MPGASALARAIAKAIAKGQVKKAARLEADALERRTLWLAFEEKAISQFNPHYVSPITAENMASARGFPPSTKLLMARGYSQARAEKLATRIHMKAAREMSTALRENAAQPLPRIPDQDAVTKAVFEATSPDFLSLAELPDIKISSILSKKFPFAKRGAFAIHEDKVYKLTPDGWAQQEIIRRPYKLDNDQ